MTAPASRLQKQRSLGDVILALRHYADGDPPTSPGLMFSKEWTEALARDLAASGLRGALPPLRVSPFDEAVEQKAFEAWADVQHPGGRRLADNVWQGWKGRAQHATLTRFVGGELERAHWLIWGNDEYPNSGPPATTLEGWLARAQAATSLPAEEQAIPTQETMLSVYEAAFEKFAVDALAPLGARHPWMQKSSRGEYLTGDVQHWRRGFYGALAMLGAVPAGTGGV